MRESEREGICEMGRQKKRAREWKQSEKREKYERKKDHTKCDLIKTAGEMECRLASL